MSFVVPSAGGRSRFEFRTTPHFVAHLSEQHHPDHFLIGKPGPQRVAKGRGAIVLDEKMRAPRERIWDDDGRENKPGAAKDDCGGEERPTGERSDRVEYTGRELAVSQNVGGPEFREGAWVLHSGILAHGSECAIG